MDNAIDASETVVRIAAARGDHEVVLTISDDGPRLPDDVAARMFEPFFSTKDGGTGMGLAIADALVDELGGQLRHVRSTGTTSFSVVVPVPAAAPGPGSGQGAGPLTASRARS